MQPLRCLSKIYGCILSIGQLVKETVSFEQVVAQAIHEVDDLCRRVAADVQDLRETAAEEEKVGISAAAPATMS